MYAMALIAMVGLQSWYQRRMQADLVQSLALVAAARHAEGLVTVRRLYTRDVIPTVRANGIEITHDFDHSEKHRNAIPLPATFSMRLGEELNRKLDGGFSRLYSDYPFPYPNRLGLRDDFARQAWAALQDPSVERFYRFTRIDGELVLRFAIADRMEAECVTCHNRHPDSPKADWTVGDVRGVLEVTHPLSVEIAQVSANSREFLGALTGLSLLGLVGFVAVVRLSRRNNRALDARARELEHANNSLESRNMELQQFAYATSHDLQTPLRHIGGFIEILRERYQGKLDDHADTLIQYTVDGVQNMTALIHGMLNFARVDSSVAAFERVDLDELVGRAIVMLAEPIAQTKATVTWDDLPAVVGDGMQLLQAFDNLLGNAIKFHGERDPVVHVSARWCDGEWTIRVRDHGIGVDPDYQKSIFEIFRRLHTDSEYPGTGIGLAVCQRIIQRHGGKIWVEAGTSRGSAFCFTLRPWRQEP